MSEKSIEEQYEVNVFRSYEPPYKIVANLNPEVRSHNEPAVLVQREQIQEFLIAHDKQYEHTAKWDVLVRTFRDVMLSPEYGWDEALCYGAQCLLVKHIKPSMRLG